MSTFGLSAEAEGKGEEEEAGSGSRRIVCGTSMRRVKADGRVGVQAEKTRMHANSTAGGAKASSVEANSVEANSVEGVPYKDSCHVMWRWMASQTSRTVWVRVRCGGQSLL